MADDDLLLNFEVGDTPGTNLVSTQYKGRWKERALSKKWDKIKARRVFNGPVKSTTPTTIPPTAVKTTNGVNGGLEKESTGTEGKRSLKRKRKQAVASSSNATPMGTRNFGSSSLFTSNPEITSTRAQKQPKVTQEHTEPTEPGSLPEPKNSDQLPSIENPADTQLVEVAEFTFLGINPTICTHLQRSLQISKPTQIQTLAIPHLIHPPHHD